MKEDNTANHLPRIMLAAGASGSGKTTVTCGLLQAFLNRGVKTVSFKCGPDYIDPMFHSEVLQMKSRNLDLFFTEKGIAIGLFCKNAKGSELSVIEGVMGYYDGLAAISTEASSYDLARTVQAPVILVIDCKGKSVSILAEIKGFAEFRPDSNIKGVILNRLSPMLYDDLKKQIQAELGIHVYGYIPVMKDCSLESRHLGLVTASEVGNLREILGKLAGQMEQSVEMDGLLELAQGAPDLHIPVQWQELSHKLREYALRKAAEEKVPVAVAQDKAFCFYYQDNLDLLEELGVKLIPFSPLRDKKLPEGVKGLILGGGYPELYLDTLSANTSLMDDVKEKLHGGLPCLAECGGFMYLHQWIEDRDGKRFAMAGVLQGGSYPLEKLGRFGYISLEANKDSVLGSRGLRLKGHEFHYWDSTHTGDTFHAAKPLRTRSWECMTADHNLLAGYPHIHYYSNPQALQRFVEACRP